MSERDDYLEDVAWALGAIQKQQAEMERQAQELEDFVTGRRQSDYTHGAVFLRNFGLWLDEMYEELKNRLSGF